MSEPVLLHHNGVHNTTVSSPQGDTAAPTPRWATKEQAAQHIGVSTKTLIRWADTGRVRRHRFGPRLIRFDLNEIDAMATTTSSPATTSQKAADQ